MNEVQTFLSRRAELCKNLPRRLPPPSKNWSSQKTAALLFPEGNGTIPKDRKPKKLKPKLTLREEKTDEAAMPTPAAAETPA